MPSGEWVGSPYARLYATLQDDHPAVWADDHLLAWYVRLLIPAERAWPIRLGWPRGLPAEVQAALVEDGAVDPQGEDRYQVHGLDRLRALQDGRTSLASLGGQARAAQGVRGPDGKYRPAGDQPAGPDTTPLDQPAGGLNGATPETLDQPPGVQPVSPARPASYTSRNTPPRAAPRGPGAGERAPAPTPVAVVDLPPNATPADVARIQADPRTIQGHPRYQALAAEEADWKAWADAQPEPSTYPDARPSNQARYGEAHPDCRTPETLEHRRYWRWIGSKWVCLYCDRADTRSFRERMDDANQSPF